LPDAELSLVNPVRNLWLTIGSLQLATWRLRVKGGHAEQVAAAAGSPQKAALLAAGRDFGLGPGAVAGPLRGSGD
jgi:hypothetical protein